MFKLFVSFHIYKFKLDLGFEGPCGNYGPVFHHDQKQVIFSLFWHVSTFRTLSLVFSGSVALPLPSITSSANHPLPLAYPLLLLRRT